MKSFDYKVWLVIVFVVVYSYFVYNVHYTFTDYAEIVAATVFFFALFAGFFITRQNDRFTRLSELIAERDGMFSYLYRVSGLVPRIQKEVKEIIRTHYEEIEKHNDWAYHIKNPSTTISDLTNAFSKLDKDDVGDKQVILTSYGYMWEVIHNLQLSRKRMLIILGERLLMFQWIIIYALALLLVVSFNFIPAPEESYIPILKIVFGSAVFMVVILLKQLNDLSLFGRNFSKKSSVDVLRILDEKDRAEK